MVGPIVDAVVPEEGVDGVNPSRGALEVSKLVTYLDGLLDAQTGDDYAPNGLQVQGTRPIKKIVVGVSACRELFERAAADAADAVLVHHGIFWRGDSPVLTGIQYHRVAALIENGLSLIAYHLPLDRHGTHGNNAVAAAQFGLGSLQGFAHHGGLPIGVRGEFDQPLAPSELQSRCADIFGQEPLAFLHGPDPVRTLALVSGAAASEFREAIDSGIDAFITGEPSEWVMNLAREASIHFLAAGHYATERLGVQSLAAHLEERFGLETVFVDIPNPV